MRPRPGTTWSVRFRPPHHGQRGQMGKEMATAVAATLDDDLVPRQSLPEAGTLQVGDRATGHDAIKPVAAWRRGRCRPRSPRGAPQPQESALPFGRRLTARDIGEDEGTTDRGPTGGALGAGGAERHQPVAADVRPHLAGGVVHPLLDLPLWTGLVGRVDEPVPGRRRRRRLASVRRSAAWATVCWSHPRARPELPHRTGRSGARAAYPDTGAVDHVRLLHLPEPLGRRVVRLPPGPAGRNEPGSRRTLRRRCGPCRPRRWESCRPGGQGA